MSARQAELLQLATNSFYALKVAFFNQLYDIGLTQETLTALADDPRIGKSHYEIVHKGYRGFGGACLVKDSRAMLQLFRNTYGIPWGDDPSDPSILEVAVYYNDDLLRAADAADTSEVVSHKRG